MSDEGVIYHCPNAHIAWLACLSFVLNKIRREGLMSIEGDVECPEEAASIFQLFPQTVAHPYIDFATDVLRLMLGCNLNADQHRVYADHYIAGLVAKSSVFTGAGVDESLLRTIWLTLWATLNGNAPLTACEFGRQAMPLKIKPSFAELETTLRDVNTKWRRRKGKNSEGGEGGLNAEVDNFIASLG